MKLVIIIVAPNLCKVLILISCRTSRRSYSQTLVLLHRKKRFFLIFALIPYIPINKTESMHQIGIPEEAQSIMNDEEKAIAMLLTSGIFPGISEKAKHDDAYLYRPARTKNKHRRFGRAKLRSNNIYFSSSWLFFELEFERRFKVSRITFDFICKCLIDKKRFFV